jgi:6-pyruvoyltetrahydropterin/6-carboxytetrahydropterin synthase
MSDVFLQRRVTFCSSHRLHSDQLSDEKNKRLFDKCNHINGHGHNYILYVTLKGRPDPITGMVMNIVDLKKIIDTVVFNKVDHKNLNLDVSEFKILNPTVENITIVFWNWLQAALPPGLLYEIKLYETENNSAIYRG